MATEPVWRTQGIATDGSLIDLGPQHSFRFAGAKFDDPIPVNTMQSSIHVIEGDKHVCLSKHLNNTTGDTNSNQVSINGAANQTITSTVPSSTQVPLIVTISRPTSFILRQAFVQAIDLDNPAQPFLHFSVLEQGVSPSWGYASGVGGMPLSVANPFSVPLTQRSWRLGVTCFLAANNEARVVNAGLRFVARWTETL